MKTKTLIIAALVGVAAVSAQAGVHWNISVGIPLPFCIGPAPGYCAPPPVVYSPPPVYYAPPTIAYAPPCPPPVYVPAYSACPGPDYVWLNGGWSHRGGYATGYGFPVNHPVQFQHRVEHIERDQYLRSLRH